MLSIQVISLIIFIIGIVAIPVIDQLFFYSAFNFKDILNGRIEKEQQESKKNLRLDKSTGEKIESNETRETPVSLENF